MLPSTGAISANQIKSELAITTSSLPLNHSRCYETVGKQQDTQISYNDFRINNNFYSKASILKGNLGNIVCSHQGHFFYGLHKFDSDHRWIKSGNIVTNGASAGVTPSLGDMYSDGTSLFVAGNNGVITQMDGDFNIIAHLTLSGMSSTASVKIAKAWSTGSGISGFFSYSYSSGTTTVYYYATIVYIVNNVVVYRKTFVQSSGYWYYRNTFTVAQLGSVGGALYQIYRMGTAYSACTNAAVIKTYDLTAATWMESVKFYLPQTVAGRTSTIYGIATTDLNGALYGVVTCSYAAGSFNGVAYPLQFAHIVFKFENNQIVWQKAISYPRQTAVSYYYYHKYADILSFNNDSIFVALGDTAYKLGALRILSTGDVQWHKTVTHSLPYSYYYNIVTDMTHDSQTDKVSVNVGTAGHITLPADGITSGLDVSFSIDDATTSYETMTLVAEPEYTSTAMSTTATTATAVYIYPNTKLTVGVVPSVTRSNI